MQQIIIFILILAIVVPFGIFMISNKQRRKERFKKTLFVNIISFFGILLFGIFIMFTGGSEAAPLSEAASASASSSGLAFLSAALATGLSCIGAGIAVSAAASAALGALSENENIMGKALIFVALAEGVAIYGLIISIMILGKV